ncbi:MAG: hypothetical protein VX777_01785 [Chlamydiota bacterium]|nr:hypothetical protein [Chlamydiota bacterium]
MAVHDFVLALFLFTTFLAGFVLVIATNEVQPRITVYRSHDYH